MLPFKRLLSPIDFSSASLQALDHAVELACAFHSELLVVHVVEPVPSVTPDFGYGMDVTGYESGVYAETEERLKETVEKRVAPALSARTLLKYGEPSREIVRIAEDEQADLIVIATHGLTGWRHLVFGSVAEKVVRTACCPVLTLRIPGQAAG